MLKLTGRVTRQGKQYLCRVEEIDQMTVIDSLDELVERVTDLVIGYFEACRDLNQMAPILRGYAIPSNKSILAEVRMVLESDGRQAQRTPPQPQPIIELPLAFSV